MFKNLARSVRAFTEELKRNGEAPPRPAAQRPKIGIALGGGFARGLAHIGVLKVLEEEGIPVDMVAGTSVGSVIGAAYCAGISGRELEEVAAVVRFSSIARYSLSRFGICSNDRLGAFLTKILKVGRFEDLKVPLAVAATDFTTGDGVIFREGPLCDPVRASCAYPGMFPPVSVNGRLLVDGMLAHVVPTVPLREMGADRVIGIFLTSKWTKQGGPRHVFEVVSQCFSIAQDKMCGLWQGAADLVLSPYVSGFGFDDFALAPALIRAGEEATRAALPQMKQWLEVPAPATEKARAPRPQVAPAQAITTG
ncbi:MAG: patatin-like phospholipase family protein [Terriglobales bacterium]